MKNKINYLKQVLFFGNNYEHPKISFIITSCKISSLYWFNYEKVTSFKLICKHKFTPKYNECDCYHRLFNKSNLPENKNLSFLDLALPSIMDFILELNLQVEPLWKLAAAQLRRSNIKVNKTNASEFAI